MFAGLKSAVSGKKSEPCDQADREVKNAEIFNKKKHRLQALEKYAGQANETIRLCLDIVNAHFEGRGAVERAESTIDKLERQLPRRISSLIWIWAKNC